MRVQDLFKTNYIMHILFFLPGLPSTHSPTDLPLPRQAWLTSPFPQPKPTRVWPTSPPGLVVQCPAQPSCEAGPLPPASTLSPAPHRPTSRARPELPAPIPLTLMHLLPGANAATVARRPSHAHPACSPFDVCHVPRCSMDDKDERSSLNPRCRALFKPWPPSPPSPGEPQCRHHAFSFPLLAVAATSFVEHLFHSSPPLPIRRAPGHATTPASPPP